MTNAQKVACKAKNCGRTDGEHSFECREEYSLAAGHADFGAALRALKEGQRVARSGWNGKGMWLALVLGYDYNPEKGAGCVYALGCKKLPWIGMKTADNGFVPWLASQTDVLAEDWVIVK